MIIMLWLLWLLEELVFASQNEKIMHLFGNGKNTTELAFKVNYYL